jgi:hypothetical protein
MNDLKAWMIFLVSGAVLSGCGEDDPDDGMGDTGADTSTGGSPTASATGASASATGSPDEPTSSGGAPADPGTCGGQDCDWAAEYCHESEYDGPSEYECRAIPPSCAETPTCECIGPRVCNVEPFGCSGEESGQTRVSCVEG